MSQRIVKGGQGRPAKSVMDSAEAWGWACILAAVLVLVAIAGCAAVAPRDAIERGVGLRR